MAGKPAATLLHLGPGLANGLANVHNARRARSPMVNIVGEHGTAHQGLQSPLETDIGTDPFLAEVAWSWLVDALDARGARYVAASGTVTKILSTGFGELARQGDGAELELRASWTPLDEVAGPHVEGWSELLCMLAGLPPSTEGVTALPRRRRRRG